MISPSGQRKTVQFGPCLSFKGALAMAAETKFRFRPWSNILPSKRPDAKLQTSIQLEDFVTASSRAVLFRKPTPQRSAPARPATSR